MVAVNRWPFTRLPLAVTGSMTQMWESLAEAGLEIKDDIVAAVEMLEDLPQTKQAHQVIKAFSAQLPTDLPVLPRPQTLFAKQPVKFKSALPMPRTLSKSKNFAEELDPLLALYPKPIKEFFPEEEHKMAFFPWLDKLVGKQSANSNTEITTDYVQPPADVSFMEDYIEDEADVAASTEAQCIDEQPVEARNTFSEFEDEPVNLDHNQNDDEGWGDFDPFSAVNNGPDWVMLGEVTEDSKDRLRVTLSEWLKQGNNNQVPQQMNKRVSQSSFDNRGVTNPNAACLPETSTDFDSHAMVVQPAVGSPDSGTELETETVADIDAIQQRLEALYVSKSTLLSDEEYIAMADDFDDDMLAEMGVDADAIMPEDVFNDMIEDVVPNTLVEETEFDVPDVEDATTFDDDDIVLMEPVFKKADKNVKAMTKPEVIEENTLLDERRLDVLDDERMSRIAKSNQFLSQSIKNLANQYFEQNNGGEDYDLI